MQKTITNTLNNPSDILRAIRLLPMRQRLKMVRVLERDTREERFDAILRRIDKRRATYPITQKEIDHEVREVRKQRYATRSR